MPDLDNSSDLYARLYEAVSAMYKDKYSADEEEFRKNIKQSDKNFTLPLADISLTTTNMDMKLK